jgi:hypothetical protein
MSQGEVMRSIRASAAKVSLFFVGLFSLFTVSPALSLPILGRSAMLFGPPKHTRGPNDTSGDSRSDEVNRLNPITPTLSRTELLITTFNDEVVSEFRKAWESVHNGNMPYECVILILRTATGFQVRRLRLTYEHKKSTFAWHPGIVAVIHTHPNDCPSAPQPDDIKIAEERGVPMFTLSNRGMFVYDPKTKRTSKVMDGVLWLDIANWEKRLSVRK